MLIEIAPPFERVMFENVNPLVAAEIFNDALPMLKLAELLW